MLKTKPASIEGILRGRNSSFSQPYPPALLLDDSSGRTAKALWWTNQELSSVDNTLPWFSILIFQLGDEQ
jgi:hypothetical protein